MKKKKEDRHELIHPLLPRDSEVLQSLTRLCFNVPHSKEFFKEVIQSAGLHVLAVLFNPTMLVLNPGMTLLDLDLVNVLIILTAGMPTLIKDSALGSFDHHVVRLCACLSLIQILASSRSNCEEKNMKGEYLQGCRKMQKLDSDPEEIDVQKLAKTVSEVVGISDTVQFKAGKVRQAMIHFLRCASMLFHYVTGVPLPTLEKDDSADDMVVYAALSEYLSLPKTMRELINDQDTFDLVHRILADDRLSSSQDVTCPEMPIKKRSLIDLPEDYTDLLNKATAYECPNWSTDRKSKSFAICLTCGDLVCYESLCCRGEVDNLKAGGCTIHSRKCGADLGLFIKLSSCHLVILSGKHKGGFFPAPYVDRFGEHDVELHRGNPLKLDKVQYQKLNKMWQTNDLQTYIAKSQRIRNPQLGLDNWFVI